MISVYHRDSGGEIQSKNLLVKRGILCKAVLQISKKHGVSFQGFCGVFLDCGISRDTVTSPSANQNITMMYYSLQGDIGFRGPPGIPGPPGKAVCT